MRLKSHTARKFSRLISNQCYSPKCFHQNREGNGNDNISSEEHFLIKKPFEVLKSLFKFYLVTQPLYVTFRHSSSGMGAGEEVRKNCC
jgi:hypothetical protein